MPVSVFADNKEYTINNHPDKCPRCNRYMEPKYIDGHLVTAPQYLLQLIYQCTFHGCGQLFIANCTLNGYDEYRGIYTNFIFIHAEPKTPEMIELKEAITELSPSFKEIYNQAAAAEAFGLTEICGAGYRKALEFLVKDYLIRKNPDQEDIIKRQFLGTCIRSIEDPNIRFCVDRATWLGNDETHYVRKWEERDLSDLKRLINLAVNWIDTALMMEMYESQMPEGR